MVVDEASGNGIDGAAITYLRRGNQLKFTYSSADGSFRLVVDKLLKDDSISVSCLGYGLRHVAVEPKGKMRIVLKAATFTLKEVNVRGNRVVGRADTTVYDLTRFASERDNTLRDVLAKLPGVDVSDNGEVKVNGKPISRFTVEGLDMTGGRYSQLEEKLRAKDVKAAEVINHDQPIKALQDKVFTDDVAINILMKDSVRDKLLLTLRPYVLDGETKSGGGSAGLMQIGRKRQRGYDAEYDRTGKDFSQLSCVMSTYNPRLGYASLPQWLNVPRLSAPIDAERLRFNTSQSYSASEVRNADDDNELRLSAHYLRTVERQQTHNEASYDLGSAEPTTTSQAQNLCLRNNDLSVEMERKLNAPNTYGSDELRLSAHKADGRAVIGDTLCQHISVPRIGFGGSLYRLYTLRWGQLTVRSVADYHHAGNDLYVNENFQGFATNLWHAAASVGLMRKRSFFTRQLTALVDAQNLNVVGNSPRLAASLSPYWQYRNNPWTFSLSVRARLERYPHQGQTLHLWDATAFVRWNRGRRNEWNTSLGYGETAANAADYALCKVWQDYRTRFTSEGFVGKNRSLSQSVEWLYKRPLAELFMNFNGSVGRIWSNVVGGLTIDGERYHYFITRRQSQSSSARAEGNISKGFFALHLKTQLSGALTFIEGEQKTSERIIDYQTTAFRLSTVVEFSPSWGALSYRGDFNWRHSAGQPTLFDWKQRLALTSTIGEVDLTFSVTHYLNDLQSGVMNASIADAKAVWRMKSVRLTLALTNLFNKREYALTQYSGVATFTNRYVLRGREIMISAQITI